MWIICQADDSHEMSKLIFSEKKMRMLSATNFAWGFNTHHAMSRWQIYDIFHIFSQKTGFDMSIKLSPLDSLHEMSKFVFLEK